LGAEQNDPSSQSHLGDLYKERRDYGKASEWYQRAAAQGNVSAEGSLGLLYYQGLGVPKDYVLAHMWLNLAAAGLSGPLTENLRKSLVKVRDLVEKEMTLDQVAEAQRLAREWKPQ
jgi:TPR repeat protein